MTMVMRACLYLFFCCLASYAPAQQPLVTLTVYRDTCIPGMSGPDRMDIRLYRLPERTFAVAFGHDLLTDETTLSALLAPGRYRTVYYNYMGQEREGMIILGNRDTTVGFCIDSLLSYPQHTLKQLRDKDSLVLDYTSEGCFHQLTARIVIRRSGDIFSAGRYEWVAATKRRRGRYKLMKYVSMDDFRMAAFLRFENELNLIPAGNNCTTEDEYHIRSPYLNLEKVDATCSWGGFSMLQYYLFDKQREQE